VSPRWARAAMAAVLVLGGALTTLLGWAWSRSARDRETPRLEPGLFETLVPGQGPLPAERWLVAINLGCSHCAGGFARVAAGPAARAAGARVTALLVDMPRRPDPRQLPSGEVLWDARQVWRRRWGRRAYGEVLCFDDAGRCLRVLPPEDPP
jgi:hypothetical protein